MFAKNQLINSTRASLFTEISRGPAGFVVIEYYPAEGCVILQKGSVPSSQSELNNYYKRCTAQCDCLYQTYTDLI